MANIAEPRRGQDRSIGDFRALFDASPIAVYTTDAGGYLTYFNPAAAQLSGRNPKIGKDKWSVIARLRRPDGAPLPLSECPMAVAIGERRPVRGIEIIAELPDGRSVPLMPFPTPLFDSEGRLAGAINMLFDISAQKQAQAALAHSADEQAALYRFTDRLYRADGVAEIYEAALDTIFTALRCSRASILMFDEAGVMRFVASRGLSMDYREAVTGHTPWKAGESDPMPIVVADFSKTDEPEDLKRTIAGEGISALAFVPLVADGGVIGKFMVYHDAPHQFSQDEIGLALTIARQLGFAIEREQARADRHQADVMRDRLTSIVENSEDAIISKDLNGIINSWNKGAERLFGYKPEEIIGRSVLTLIPPELQHEEPGIISRISSGQRVEHFETERVRQNGERIYISLTVSPVKDGQGRIVGASKIARDITERKRAEEQRTLLINELNHRVKNTLATVQSLAMQTLRNTERSEEARELFESRLSALSRAHDLLTNESWEGANLAEVVDRALSPFSVSGERIRAEGAFVRLSPRQALALSIALHELATNASKYGALSEDGGHVDVRWGVEGGQFNLKWTEAGGPPVSAPTRSGFGTRLIQRNLAAELDGSAVIEYRPSGVVAEISAPLEQRRAER